MVHPRRLLRVPDLRGPVHGGGQDQVLVAPAVRVRVRVACDARDEALVALEDLKHGLRNRMCHQRGSSTGHI